MYFMWCDIRDPQAVLDLLEEGHTPLLVCIPSVGRYNADPLYRKAVDTYNAEIVRVALRGEEDENVQER